MTQPNREPKSAESDLCSDCPPVGYPTDETRCNPCPRRSPETAHVEPEGEVLKEHTAAVGAFLSDLYCIMVDPCAEGPLTVAETMKALRDAALQQREALNAPSEGEVDALVAEADMTAWIGEFYASDKALAGYTDADMARFLARRLASALSSRRALSREEIARIIDPRSWSNFDYWSARPDRGIMTVEQTAEDGRPVPLQGRRHPLQGRPAVKVRRGGGVSEAPCPFPKGHKITDRDGVRSCVLCHKTWERDGTETWTAFGFAPTPPEAEQ